MENCLLLDFFKMIFLLKTREAWEKKYHFKGPNPSNFLHHLEVITVVSLTSWKENEMRKRKGRKKVRNDERKKGENYMPQLRKLTITIKGMKLFWFTTLWHFNEIPRAMKYNGRVSNEWENIKGKLLLLFLFLSCTVRHHLLSVEDLTPCKWKETKEVIHRNFNWTFISLLKNDFQFGTPPSLQKPAFSRVRQWKRGKMVVEGWQMVERNFCLVHDFHYFHLVLSDTNWLFLVLISLF